jgi:hypothetical protein
MKRSCTVKRQSGGGWVARHRGSDLGDVDVSGSTREEALTKMQRELQYRIERCPCSGVSGDTVELIVHEADDAP